MKTILLQSINTVIVGTLSLIGVLIGLFFPAAINFIRFRYNRKIEINKVISISLEVWWVYASSNTALSFKYLLDELSKTAKKITITDEDIKIAEGYVEQLLKPLTINLQNDRMDRIKNQYIESISVLSTYSPILSFRLRGMEKLYEDIDKIYNDMVGFLKQFKAVFNSTDQLIELIKNAAHNSQTHRRYQKKYFRNRFLVRCGNLYQVKTFLYEP